MIVLSILAAILFLIETALFSVLSIIPALVDRSGNYYLWTARLWARLSMLIFGIRIRVTGLEHLNPEGHFIYVANHSSYIDIPILLAAIPANIRLVMRSSLTRIPIWGWSLLASPFIIMDRSSAAKAERTLKEAVETIRNGASILLFPEGTRTHTGEMQQFKRGAFHLAYDAGTPIQPVAILGAFQILNRDSILPHWGKRAEVRIGEAIVPREVSTELVRAEEVRLMKEAERSVRELIAESPK